ncbi:MAG: NADH-quinone oxidoreductase subunit L [Actinomycetota bacterium]|nr:NADH-quinone oxidoreductase subunit L [Actinomycetota bacterium]
MISDYAWLIPTLPALSAVLIIAFGRRLPKHGAEVGITALALALGLAVAVAGEVFSANVAAVAQVEAAHEAEDGEAHGEEGGEAHGEEGAAAEPTVVQVAAAAEEEEAPAIPEGVSSFLNERAVPLTPFGGPFGFEAGMRVDGLAAMMFLLVTAVSLMVHIYSTSYMHGDPRYTWYFALLSMFTASMLLLVIGNNLMMVLVGWELVGVCSFLLIGFWWEDKANQDAAIKAFLTTKLGDVGLVVGVITLWGIFKTFNIGAIIAAVEAGNYSQGLLTFGLIALFVGAIGKSAQFPLHTWLPDAMAGPTPVSALIHAATMVTAGIFLVARLYPVFQASDTAMAVIAVVGSITLFMAGLLAVVQDDVKKVLAYSTISQLGYMVAALAFSYTAGIFHLFTHGFFKALLFLGAGSLIHAVHSNNMSDMGGLKRYMPVTFWTFLIGSAALAALPPLAGFWSKDEVLAGAFSAGATYPSLLLLGLGGVGGLLTAFYMTRVLWLVFGGQFRGHGHPHESPPAMAVPLLILAVPAALIGLVNLPFDRFHPVGFAAWTMFSLEYFEGHPAEFIVPLALGATVVALIGVGLGTALYRRAPAKDPMLQLGPVSATLVNKYYLDRLYTDAIVRTGIRTKLANAAYWFNDHVIDRAVYLAGVGTGRLGAGTYRYADQRAIDGAVNGFAGAAGFLGREVFRKFQSGNVQLYAGGMFAGVFLLAVLFAAAA